MKLKLVALTLLCITSPALADAPLMDTLAGTWDDMESFITVGQCATAPGSAQLYNCNPAKLSEVKKGRLEAAGFISATDTVMAIADTLRKNEISSSDIDKLFSSYNYSELLISSHVSYVAPNFLMGVRPVRLSGQFQVHNPNLPFASLTYRDDLDVYGGTGFAFSVGELSVSVGAIGTVLYRKEVLSEASIADFVSKPSSELLTTQTLDGAFADLGATVELPNTFTFSALFKDLGGFWRGQDLSPQFLFILPDRIPRLYVSASAIPSLGVGNLQAGGQIISFLNRQNTLSNQWFGTLSYFAGPLSILSGFRPGLFRTGLGMRFSQLEVTVAQEWVNQLETGRQAQPRFILGMAVGL